MQRPAGSIMSAMHLFPRLIVLACAMQEKCRCWQQSFGQRLGLRVEELTGDSDDAEATGLDEADIICTTPEKLGEQHILFRLQRDAPCLRPPQDLVRTFAYYLLSWPVVRCKLECEHSNWFLFQLDDAADSMTRRRNDQGGARFLGEVIFLPRP